MIVPAVSVVALLCLYGYFRWSRRRLYRMSRDVPDVAPSLPIIGHTHYFIGLDNSSIFKAIVEASEMTNQLQGVSKLWIGPELYYLLTDPNDVAVALNHCVDKSNIFKFIRNFIGNGLLASEAPFLGPLLSTGLLQPYWDWKGLDLKSPRWSSAGWRLLTTVTTSGTDGLTCSPRHGAENIWKHRHKKLLPAFSQKLLNGFIPVFNKQFSLMVDEMESESEWFDPGSYINPANLEVVCQTAMGLPKEQKNAVSPSYLAALDTASNLAAERMAKVWLYPDFIYRLLGYKKIEDEAITVLKHASNSVIKLKKTEFENKLSDGVQESKVERGHLNTFLDLLLELSTEDSIFTDEAIREEVDTMIAAAQDTTATTAQFVLLLLGSHQDKQEKVLDEINEVFGNSDRDVTKEDLNKLQYLESAINETLRLYPLVMTILRLVKKDIKLKTCTLPEGSNIVVLPWGIHRHERWGADYDRFRPERWFEPDCPSKTPGAFCPFGAGKRMCIGRVYAMMSLKIMIVHIIRKYRVYADIKRLEIGYGVLQNFKSGNEIRIEKRQNCN